MHEIAKKVVTNSLSLFLVSLLFSGLVVSGGFVNYVIAGALLALLSIIFDPFVKVVTLPFNILTLGLLSFLTILVALFVLTFFYPAIAVNEFTFSGFSFIGLSIGTIHFSRVLSFVVISATIYFSNRLIGWLFG
jgi:putative membrane protein